jgi:phage terminase small subunit
MAKAKAEKPELTPKQAQFVREYLIDLNATQAAIRCGYSEKTAYSQGQRLLKHVEVAAAVQSAMDARAERTEISADRVLSELAKIGFADIRKAVRWGAEPVDVDAEPDEEMESQPHGGSLQRLRRPMANVVELVASDEIDPDTAAAISEVSQTAAGLKIKLHDKRAALVDIGRHLGMFTERVEHSGPGGGPIQYANLSDDEIDRRIAQLSGKA